ncbi:f-box domain-containing protein [Gigaspora margarita]|uniref:F-box domain-containing protein n=1 Tax=Gigaspora margarita TaxID=4874 RepID=A0A8H4EQU2_GIGMA|nr:f-box domain-containing protein [Gigaspora margarita]
MNTLPNECYYAIFNKLERNYRSLFSCALVNRQWCKIIIPILWREPTIHLKDARLIRIFLLTLNTEEQALLIPFKISLPSHPKPLFEYTSYITSVSNDLYDGIKKWLPYKTENELENAIKCSLIAMFLRTSKNLRHLSLNGPICNQTIFENLYKKTTITSMDLCEFKYKAIDGLVTFLNKNSTLTSLNLRSIQLEYEGS